jgi:hypothetical protein
MVSPGLQFGTAVLNVDGSAGEPSLFSSVRARVDQIKRGQEKRVVQINKGRKS